LPSGNKGLISAKVGVLSIQAKTHSVETSGMPHEQNALISGLQRNMRKPGLAIPV